jgi:opacity protein-like surface antigen
VRGGRATTRLCCRWLVESSSGLTTPHGQSFTCPTVALVPQLRGDHTKLWKTAFHALRERQISQTSFSYRRHVFVGRYARHFRAKAIAAWGPQSRHKMKNVTGKTLVLACALATTSLASPVRADGFSGPYIGITGHYGWSKVDAKVERISSPFTATATAREQGPSIGGIAGYDWKLSQSGVVGIASDFTAAKFGSSVSYVSSFRGRVGHLVGNDTLLYATGGLALIKSDLSGHLGGFDYSLTGWVPGWAVGGGIEHRRIWGAHPVRIGAEIMYLDFNPRHFEVPDRRATLNYSGWTIGTRIAFELDRSTPQVQPMK